LNPPTVPKSQKPSRINIGILGAAAIAPTALILPAQSHNDVVVIAVAARDKTKAEKFAKKYGIAKAYGGSNGYQGQSRFGVG
jgi:predicted dehydrogenase